MKSLEGVACAIVRITSLTVIWVSYRIDLLFLGELVLHLLTKVSWVLLGVKFILSLNHGFEVLGLIVSDVEEYVIKISDDWSSRSWLSAGLEIVKHESLRLVVLLGNLWGWKSFQVLGVFIEELVIGLISVLFNLFREVVGKIWFDKVEHNASPVVKYGSVLSKESVSPLSVSTKLFHNEEMMELIPTFSPMDSEPSDVVVETDGLKIMEGRDVGEVWNTGDGFKDIESLVWLIIIKQIDQKDDIVDKLFHEGGFILVDWKSIGNEFVKVIFVIEFVITISFSITFFDLGLDLTVHFFEFILLLSSLWGNQMNSLKTYFHIKIFVVLINHDFFNFLHGFFHLSFA